MSLRDSLEAVYKQTGKIPPELQSMIEAPESLVQIWYWFCALNNTRSDNMQGECPITYSEMLAYFTLQNIDVDSWEIDIIKKIDHVYLAYQSERRSTQSKPTKPNNTKR